MGATRIRVLGPFEVSDGDEPVEVAGHQQRTLLALLAAGGGQVLSLSSLARQLWGQDPPPNAERTVRTYISRLRSVLPADLIVTRPPGYALRLGQDTVDAGQFERLAAAGRRTLHDGLPAAAATELAAALGLWRGDAYGEFGDVVALCTESARLDQARLSALQDRIDADLAAGAGDELVAELEGLTEAHPGHERLWGQLMTVLYRAGRTADALATYHKVREALVDETGMEPSLALTEIHQRILTQDPHLIAPRTADKSTLPADTGAFTGRAREIEQITAAASGGQVLVIHAIAGMPGIGKTALAVHVAHQLGERFPDGRVFVNLHGHTAGRSPAEPGDVLARLLAADGVDPRQLPAGTEARSALWRARLAGRRALIVLDNAVDSAQVSPLLPASAGCLVLVTSRRFLGDLPADTVPVSLDVLTAAEAEQMFLHLAPHAAACREQVADLVAACGHLPLAVSLLARVLGRHRGWTVADLLTETRTRLLAVTAEHVSVGAAFELSYQDLPAARQRFFRQLALHPGTEIEPHAAAALAGVSRDEATGELDALHADSLLIEVGYHRYVMHDLIRSYAGSLAAHDEAGDRAEATDRLLDFYQRTAAAADAQLSRLTRPGLDRTAGRPMNTEQALSWLRTERANLLACLAGTNDRRRTVELTAGLTELLRRDGPWTDALTLHTRAAEAASDLGDEVEHANALGDLATVRRLSGDYPGAARDMRLALEIHQDLGNRLGEANARTGLGKALSRTADYAAAASVVTPALELYRDLGDLPGEAGVLVELAVANGMTSDFHRAQELFSRALAIYRQLGDRSGQAYALRILGTTHGRLGDYTGARDLLQLGLDLYRQLGSRLGEALTLTDLGLALTGTGDYPEAARCLRTALALHSELDHRVGQSTALLYLGGALRRAGDLPRAAAALQEALVLNRDIRSRSGEAWTLNELGRVHQLTGDVDRAVAAHQEALELATLVSSPWEQAQSLAGFGRCALARDRRREGTARLREALDIFRRLNAAEAVEVAEELAALS